MIHERLTEQFEEITAIQRLHRYWSSKSQSYAAGDQLLRYLEEGWGVDARVEVERHWFGEARHVLIYHFTLHKGNHRLAMPVLAGPHIQYLVQINRHLLELVYIAERAPKRIRFEAITDAESHASELQAN